MRIGIICPSDIALRRFMPAVKLVEGIEFIGLGVCTKGERFGSNLPNRELIDEVLRIERDKAQTFCIQYGGKIFEGYETIVRSPEIDAIYIPLPPALHYRWAKTALENGKHVLIEKPSTISADHTKVLTDIARKNKLALHENYMFNFHRQLDEIEQLIADGEIGDVRLYRISFGFPRRENNDFRYNKELGGGALIDAGGYVLKYAARLLGDTAKVKYAQMNYTDEFEVDLYGSAALVNSDGVTAQVAFGMDNDYKCELEVWGSKGSLKTGRILTAPVGFTSELTIRKGNRDIKRNLPADDAFKKSIERFRACIDNATIREANYEELIKQAELVDEFRKNAKV